MARPRIVPRKLLVASIGVATLNYLGVAPTACGGTTIEEGAGGNAGLGGNAGVAGSAHAGNSGTAPPPMPTVANLVAPPHPPPTVTNPFPPPPPTSPPPPPTVANLMAPPPPPTVANLMPPPPPPKVGHPDAGATEDGGSPKDASAD